MAQTSPQEIHSHESLCQPSHSEQQHGIPFLQPVSSTPSAATVKRDDSEHDLKTTSLIPEHQRKQLVNMKMYLNFSSVWLFAEAHVHSVSGCPVECCQWERLSLGKTDKQWASTPNSDA